MTIEKINNHVEIAKSRLNNFYVKNSNTKFNALIESLIEPFQQLEDEGFKLLTDTILLTALGVQLDIIGLKVGEKRLGRNDENYRLGIFTRIAINNSGATPNSIINLIKSIAQPIYMSYSEVYPANISIFLRTNIAANSLKPVLDSIVPAGVGTTLTYSSTPPFLMVDFLNVIVPYKIDDNHDYNLLIETDNGDGYFAVSAYQTDIQGNSIYSKENIAAGFAELAITPQVLLVEQNTLYSIGEKEILLLQSDDDYEYCTVGAYGGSLVEIS